MDTISEERDLLSAVIVDLSRLKLDEIGRSWVKAIWDSQFTEVEEIPEDYNDERPTNIRMGKIFDKVLFIRGLY